MRNSTRLVVLNKPKLANTALWLWLDAADLSTITLNGSSVSEWRDKSGNGRHASQSIELNRPSIGDKSIVFSRTTDFENLAIANFIVDIGNFSMFVVGQGDASSYFVGSGITPRTYLATSLATVGRFDGEQNDQISFSSRTNHEIFCVESFGTQTISSARVLVNDVQVGEKLNYPISLPASQSLLIGSRINGDITSTLSGFISEIIIVPNGRQELSIGRRQLITGYLAHKWNLATKLPSTHPFRFTPPF